MGKASASEKPTYIPTKQTKREARKKEEKGQDRQFEITWYLFLMYLVLFSAYAATVLPYLYISRTSAMALLKPLVLIVGAYTRNRRRVSRKNSISRLRGVFFFSKYVRIHIYLDHTWYVRIYSTNLAICTYGIYYEYMDMILLYDITYK